MAYNSPEDRRWLAAMARQAEEDREVVEMCLAAGCTLAEAEAGIRGGVV